MDNQQVLTVIINISSPEMDEKELEDAIMRFFRIHESGGVSINNNELHFDYNHILFAGNK